MSSGSQVVDPSTDSSRARGLRRAGTALVALSFAMPFFAIAPGWNTSFLAGEQTVWTLLALTVLMVLARLGGKRLRESAQAWTRLGVGLALVCVVAARLTAAHVSEAATAQTTQAVHDALALEAAYGAKVADLDRRFDQVDLMQIVTVEAMTSTPSLATSRARVAQYQALLAERRSLLQTYGAQYERFMATVSDPQARRIAMAASHHELQAATDQMYGTLDVAQTQLIDSMARVLDWADSPEGHLQRRGEQLVFSSPEQKATLNALIGQMSQAEARFNEVVRQASQQSAPVQRRERGAQPETDTARVAPQ